MYMLICNCKIPVLGKLTRHMLVNFRICNIPVNLGSSIVFGNLEHSEKTKSNRPHCIKFSLSYEPSLVENEINAELHHTYCLFLAEMCSKSAKYIEHR